MRILVKLGGTLLDSSASRSRLASEIAAVAACGIETVVVHGGGKQMTLFLAERGIASRFIHGLRVTTPETLDAVLKVLAGSVNHELVAACVAAGARAVGLSGIDAALVEAEPMDPELGAVGRPVRANAALLALLVSAGYLPVVACVAVGPGGRIFNVNADQMASACAAAFRADRLLFLTDVEGVLDSSGELVDTLTSDDCETLVAGGIATGGMRAKLDAAVSALRNGVGEIRIAPGAQPGIMAKLLEGGRVGTRLVRPDSTHA